MEDQPTLGAPAAKPIDTILEIDNESVSNHSLNVIRMIPAGFYILGVFITSPTSIFDDSEAFRKIKLILVDINKSINLNGLLSGNSDEYDKGEKLVLHYSSINHQTTCKSVEVTESAKTMVSKPVDLKFQDRSTSWTLFETHYELDEIFPLMKTGVRINTEENLNKSLKSISEQLKKSMVFFDGEHISETETLESLNKLKKNKESSIQVTIYLPCSNDDDSDKIKQIQGTVRYSGIISSRVYAHSKNTIRDIQHFIKNDIIRSLAARTQIHCDALMENEVTDGVVINEPPRRVYFPIKTLPNIQFCDYLFRGESEETATRQIKELLDIELTRKDIISDVESLPGIFIDILAKTYFLFFIFLETIDEEI